MPVVATSFSVEYSLLCPKDGFPTIQHSEIRDLTANLMSEVCHDVCIEPTLQPITGLSDALAILQKMVLGYYIDVAPSGFWKVGLNAPSLI